MPRNPHGFSVLKLQIALAILFVALLGGGGWWYFTHSRKPNLAQSTPTPNQSKPTQSAPAPSKSATVPTPATVAAKLPPATANQILLMTPFVVPTAQSAVAPPAPVPAVAETIALRKLPDISTGERPDLLLAKRTERRFARLREWSARLSAKKAALKTPLQIEAFNEEAAKYHAELTAARAESAGHSP